MKEDLQFWKQQAEEAIAARKELKEAYRGLKEQFESLSAKESERALKEAREREESELSKLSEQGRYQEALASLEKKHAVEKTTLESRYQALIGKTLIPAAIRSAAAGANVTAEALNDLPALLKDTLRFNVETGALEVVGTDGQILKDERLQPVAVQVHVESFIKSRPYLLRDTMVRSSGLRPGDGAHKTAVTMEQALANPAANEAWKKADPEGYKKALDEYNSPANMIQRAKQKVKG